MKTFKFIALYLLVYSPTGLALNVQPLASIKEAVIAFVNASLDGSGKYEIEASPFDANLQLPICEQTLDVFAQTGQVNPGRNTIGIRCKGNQSWLIYNNVSVKIYKSILILAKPLRKNEIIHTQDLISENRDISRLNQGYITNPDEIINKQASRNLAVGTVLTKLSYQEPNLVKRGQQVNIKIGNSSISIMATGIAMQDGLKGDRIKVKNISSQKIIQAQVDDAGVVLVNY